MNLFIFRRDLRLYDNTALIESLNDDETATVFIFDPEQIKNNEYKSEKAVKFMVSSLYDLSNDIKGYNQRLALFAGAPLKIIKRIISENKITGIYLNRDYTPFSIKRDNYIMELCRKNNIKFNAFDDYFLSDPEIKNKNNNYYKNFSAFYRAASVLNVRNPDYKIKFSNLTSIDGDDIELKYSGNGRKNALVKMNEFIKKDYSLRDIPALNMSLKLSSDIKFGNISIREAYFMANNNEFRRQLYWRDFYLYIAYHFPYVFGSNFNKSNHKYDNNKKYIEAWKNGITGYPIVDAAMRDLNETGYINNRLRLIVSSFLVKDLHVDWRIGERYFAKKLVDYDPASNNGNWQWIASTGTDPMGSYRRLNPWIQQRRFDPECLYIKSHVAELSDLDPDIIHNIYKIELKNYPRPIVDHKNAVEEFKRLNSNISIIDKDLQSW